MTIEWHYTAGEDFSVLSLSGRLGPEGAHRFTGAVGWVLARGAGPVVVDMNGLRSWSVNGRLAVIEAARRLSTHGRSLELASIPADGSLMPDSDCPPITIHTALRRTSRDMTRTARAVTVNNSGVPAAGQPDCWPLSSPGTLDPEKTEHQEGCPGPGRRRTAPARGPHRIAAAVRPGGWRRGST
ncbi:STAS domain-containing protein [Streptomyces rhizosphaerihabitans]|uniref:STAS domain-containing protein n=1 Tax=Streptomyces rhizosphaerihabitans TaxID=1266770 RepID=UPI0028F71F8C|nr:STAS domain-containing protein [Streptomyces rhizosphaerihabitans]